MAKLTRRNINVLTIILFALTGALIGFIWFRSTLSAADSTVESEGVLGILQGICAFFGVSAELTDHIVRKAAHFCEFAALGFMAFWSSYRLCRKILRNLMPVGFVCLAVAVIDEYIQTFSPGRSCEVGDVILDFAGSLCGVLVITAFIGLRRLIKGRR